MQQIELDFSRASMLADQGMDIAVLNADSHHKEWSNAALQWVVVFARFAGGRAFMAEDIRQYAHERGFEEPPSARSWGMIMKRAARAGIIRAVGYGLTRNPLAHKTPARLWAAA